MNRCRPEKKNNRTWDSVQKNPQMRRKRGPKHRRDNVQGARNVVSRETQRRIKVERESRTSKVRDGTPEPRSQTTRSGTQGPRNQTARARTQGPKSEKTAEAGTQGPKSEKPPGQEPKYPRQSVRDGTQYPREEATNKRRTCPTSCSESDSIGAKWKRAFGQMEVPHSWSEGSWQALKR